MKQITDNNNQHSEQRGWELLWLATGLFPASKNLIKDLTLFQKSRKVRITRMDYQNCLGFMTLNLES